jgi:hypothetical protein
MNSIKVSVPLGSNLKNQKLEGMKSSRKALVPKIYICSVLIRSK